MSDTRPEGDTRTAHGSGGELGLDLRATGSGEHALVLEDQVFFDWLGIKRLELEVPRHASVASISAADAPSHGRLQRRRTRLGVAWLHITPERLERYLASRSAAFQEAGIQDLSVHCCDGYLSVAARILEGRNQAEVTCRMHVCARGLSVDVLASRPRVYGYLPSPMPVVVHRLCAAVLDISSADKQRQRAAGEFYPAYSGLGQLTLAPLDAFLWNVLPAAGWRLPSTAGAVLTTVRVSARGIELSYECAGEQRGADASVQATEDVRAANDQLRAGDDALLANDIDSALRLYRAEMAAGGPDQPHVLERILGVESIHPAYFTEAADLARQTLNRFPELVTAHLVLANLAMVEGELETAGIHYRHVVELTADDPQDAVRAAKAAARAWIAIEPNEATAMYERVLEYDPADQAASSALLERYAHEGRYFELAAMLRARIDEEPEARTRGELHLRLAEVLGVRLRDHESALVELEAACELLPDEPRVFEALAARHRADGRFEDAIGALDQAVRLAHGRGDSAAELRALLSIAESDLEAGQLAQARTGFQSALAIDEHEPRALVGIAVTCTAEGEHLAAVAAWQRVIDTRDPGLADEQLARHYLALGRAAHAAHQAETARHALTEVPRLSAGEMAAEAHTLLAELHRQADDHDSALASLDAAVQELARAADTIFAETAVQEARRDPTHVPPGGVDRRDSSEDDDERQQESERYLGRAAELSLLRAALLKRIDRPEQARADYERAHELARSNHPDKARMAARALLEGDTERGDREGQRRWIDALLDTGPEPDERQDLLLSRAELRSHEAGDTLGAMNDIQAVLGETSDEAKRALALGLQARLLALSGDRVGQASALSERAELAERVSERISARVEAAAAWLRAEDTTQALSMAAAAVAELERADAEGESVPDEVRVRALEEFGELAWRRRQFDGVVRAYQELYQLAEQDRAGNAAERVRYVYRCGMAWDALGDAERAIEYLHQLIALGEDAPIQDRVIAWQSLAKIHERYEQLLPAARSYEALASDENLASEPLVRTDAWYRAGELYRRAGAATDDVRRCMINALEPSPDHLPALDALERLETEVGDKRRLAEVLRRKLATAGGHRDRRRAVLIRLADLYQHIDEFGAALERYRELLQLDPDFRPALRFIADYAAHQGDLDSAADHYEQLSRVLSGDDQADAGELLQERVLAAQAMVHLVAHGQDDPHRQQLAQRARAVIAQLLVVAPSHPVLTACSVDVEGLVAPPLAPDVEPQDKSIPEAAPATPATIAIAELDAPAQASARPSTESDLRSLREHADQAAEEGDHEACAAALEAMVVTMAASGKATRARQRTRRAEVFLELADLYYDHLGDRKRARQAMFSAAESYGSGSRRDATLRILAAEALADGADHDAIEAYERIEITRQSPADRYNLAACFQRIGRNYRALTVLEEAEESGQLTDQGARLLLLTRQELATAGERARMLEQRAEHATAAVAREFLQEALELHQVSIGDRDAATRVQSRLHAIESGAHRVEPESTGTAVPEEILADGAQPAVVAAARAEADDASSEPRPSTAQARLEQLVDTALDSGDSADAAEQLARAIILRTEKLAAEAKPLDETTAAAIDRLRDVTEESGSFEPLVRVLAAVAKMVDDPVAASALFAEVALLYRERLGSRIRSGEALMHAIVANPTDSMLIHEAELLFGQLGDYPRLADAYELYAETLDDTQRAHVLVMLGRIHLEELDDERRAGDCYARARQADPENTDAWWPLADIRARQGDVDGALALYRQLLERVDEPEVREQIESRIADLETPADDEPDFQPFTPAQSAHGAPSSAELLARGSVLESKGQWDAAIAAYEAAAVKRPNDLLPLEAVARLYSDLGEGEALLGVIDRMLARAHEGRERARLYFRQAEICRELLQRDTDSYQYMHKAHESDPEDQDIAYALRVNAMARGEWATAAHLIGGEITHVDDAREAGALHFELALIYDEKLLDARSARENYERALELDPEIPAAPRPLARLYELEGRFADAAVMHERAANALRNTGQRAHLLQRAAECAERAGIIDHARQLYRAAVEYATNDQELRSAASSALARLDHDAAHADGGGSLVGEREQQVVELRNHLEHATRTNDRTRSETLARELMERDPADATAYAILAADAEAHADWSTLTSLLQARAKAVAVFDEKAAAYYSLGAVYQLRLHDHNSAVDAYENALRAMPDHPSALEALAGIAFEQRDFGRARELYSRLPEDKTSITPHVLAFRLGIIAEGLGDDHGALAAFSHAAELMPNSPEILAGLARAAMRTGSLDAAIKAARAQLDLLPVNDVQAVAEARLELAKLYAKIGDTEQAIGFNELVLSENPRSQPALRALYSLYLERRKFEDAATILSTIISMTGSLTRRAELLYSLGELYLVQMSDFDRAADAYLKGADLDPEHVPILRRLIDYYWREDEPDELIDIVHALVDRAGLLEPETDEATLVRTLLTAAAQGDAGLSDSIAEYLGPHFMDAMLGVLIEATTWEGEGPPVQALAENLLAVHEIRPTFELPALIGRLAREGASDTTTKLVATLRTMYSIRGRTR